MLLGLVWCCFCSNFPFDMNVFDDNNDVCALLSRTFCACVYSIIGLVVKFPLAMREPRVR